MGNTEGTQQQLAHSKGSPGVSCHYYYYHLPGQNEALGGELCALSRPLPEPTTEHGVGTGFIWMKGFDSWQKKCLERSSNLPKVTQQIGGRVPVSSTSTAPHAFSGRSAEEQPWAPGCKGQSCATQYGNHQPRVRPGNAILVQLMSWIVPLI